MSVSVRSLALLVTVVAFVCSKHSLAADSIVTGNSPKVQLDIEKVEKVGSIIAFSGMVKNISTGNEFALTPYFTAKIVSESQNGKTVGTGISNVTLRQGGESTFYLQALLSSDYDVHDLRYSITCSIPSVINFNKKQAEKSGPAEANADDVAAECKRNQVAAKNKYGGKVIVGHGIIRSFTSYKDSGLVSIHVRLQSKYSVIGHIPSNDPLVNELSVGQQVTMTGPVTDMKDMGNLGGMITLGNVKIATGKQ